MPTFRGVFYFGTRPGYVPPAGYAAPRPAGWTTVTHLTAADLGAAMTQLEALRLLLTPVMHEAYSIQAAKVSNVTVYRDILTHLYDLDFYKGELVSADGWIAAEPEWCALLDLQANPGFGGGRAFLHGLARKLGGSFPNVDIGQVFCSPTAAEFVAIKDQYVNNFFGYRKVATPHFPAGVYGYVSGDVQLDERKVGRPFAFSPLVFKRR